MQPTFLITGEYQHADFSAVLKSLEGNAIQLPVERFWGLTEQNKANLKLVIIAETSRNQVTRAFVESIRDQIPMARILIVQNDWCTGKKLPEQIYPGVTYREVSQWDTFFQKHVVADSFGSEIFDLPETANQVDRHIFLADRSRPELAGLKLGIVANCAADFDAIALAVTEFGGTATWLDESVPEIHDGNAQNAANYDCLIVNSTISGVDFESIERIHLAVAQKNLPIVLIANFPRQADRDRAFTLGILELVPQPFLLEQFQFAIQSAIARHQQKTSSLIKRGVIY